MSLISFITSKKWTIIILLCLLLNLFIATNIRLKRVSSLEGKYLRGHDPYHFYHYAKLILKNDGLPKQDMTAWMPSGVPTNEQLTLNSYVIAYLYKFLKLFLPAITLEQVAIYYPVICFALSLIAFFLLVSALFNSSFALLCTTILAIVPALISRTESGFADRDSLCLLELFLSFYFYAKFQKATSAKRLLVFAFTSGIFMGILGLTWLGVGLVMMIVVIFNLVRFMSHNYRKIDAWGFLAWYVPVLIMIMTFTNSYRHLSQPFVLLALVPSILFLILITIYFILSEHQLKSRLTLNDRLPFPLVFSGLMLILGLGLLSVIFGPANCLRGIDLFRKYLSYPLGYDKVMLTVAELYHSYFSHWLSWYGPLFFLSLVGIILIMKGLVSVYNLHSQISLCAFVLLLAVVLLSSISPKPPLNGDTFLTQWMYAASVFAFIIILAILYIHNHWRSPLQENNKSELDNVFLFLFIWFMITLLATRSARRFNLFFAPSAAILGCYVIMRLLKIITQERDTIVNRLVVYIVLSALSWEALAFGKNLLTIPVPASTSITCYMTSHFRLNANISFAFLTFFIIFGVNLLRNNITSRRSIRLTGWIITALFVVVILGGIPKLSKGYARTNIKGMEMPSGLWSKTLEWIKDKTPKDATFAAWWDYGYWINALGERATIVDARVYSPDGIPLLAKHAFMAQSEQEALEFLKGLQVTHLLITSMNVSRMLNVISAIGSDNQDNRRTSLPLFSLNGRAIPTKNGQILHFTPRTERIVGYRKLQIGDKSYDRGNWFIKDIYVEVNTENAPISSTVVIDANNEQLQLPPKEVYLKEHKFVAEGKTLPGIIAILPIRKWYAIYLDEIALKSLMIQLYVFNKTSDNFELVYPVKPEEQDAKEDDSFSGLLTERSIKIWKIHYPE